MADYIEREALLEKQTTPLGLKCKVVSVNDIENASAADVAPVRHGRWIMKEIMIRSPYAKNAYCSECLEETAYFHNYCPNCGARMDLED